jgi:photoactive yellow protein
MTAVDFSDPELAKAVEALSDEEKHALPFGVIKLDEKGLVTFFSATEARQSGYKRRPTLGLDFFLSIAPCMGVPEFKGRVDDARRRGAVDIEMGWVGDFDDPNREMVVRIRSASDGGLWIFLNRDDDGA